MSAHLSEACRTSNTLDRATDRFVRRSPDMELMCPNRPRVTRLLFAESGPACGHRPRRDTPLEHMFDSWPWCVYIQCMSDSNDTPSTSSSVGSEGRLRSVDPALTERQRTILNVIRASVTSRVYPPSIREIGDAVGLTSTSSVAHQLRTLERKGYLRRDPNRPRAVDVRGTEETAAAHAVLTEVAGSHALPAPTFVPVL